LEESPLISKKNYFKNLEKITRQLTDGINELSKKYNKKVYADSEGGMFGIYFTNKKVTNYDSISKSDIKKFIQFFKFMLKNKIYFAPSAYEAGFVSSAHTANNINYTLDIFEKWIKN